MIHLRKFNEINHEPNQKGYYLHLYNLVPCELISIGRVNYKVKSTISETIRYINPDKFVGEDEVICVVWEMNRGVEGAYRIEKNLYPDRRRVAKLYPHQALVWETFYGIEDSHVDPRLIN